VVQLTVKPKDEPLLGGAKLRRVLDQSFQNGLEVEGGAADDLEHVGGRGLLRQRFAQFVEQARIFDRDDGLAGEVLDEIDLLFSERTHFLTVDHNHTDRFVFFEHRHGDVRPCATEPSRRIQCVLGSKIRDMDCLFGVDGVPEAARRTRLKSPAPLIVFDKGCWHPEMRNRANATALAQEHLTKFGLADRDGMLQHRLEHRLKFSRRTGNDTQHLRGRGLLF
jgi:hypothetical protein